MKAKISYVLLFVLAVALFGEHTLSFPRIYAMEAVPSMLKITGKIMSNDSSNGGNSEGLQITDVQLVREIYHDIMALPAESAQEICPMYIKAEYRLAFLYNASSLLTASVRQGGCSTVTLGRGDIRAINTSFERLLKKAIGQTTSPSEGLTPSDLQNAYALPSAISGKGQTVALVDAYNDPNAEADMNVYRSHFHLPRCTIKNGCFKKVDEHGGTHYPATDQAWAAEIALNLEMISAICPNCHILLVEANDAYFRDLGIAVDTAVHLGAHIVNNTYGSREKLTDARAMAHYYNHPGVIITASSGDLGYGGVQLPAAFSSVVAVGATSLSRDPQAARGWRESTWSATGSGCSKYINKPAWQKDKGCAKRSIPDISAVGDPDTGVAVYNTYDSNGWEVDGSTTVASTIIAGIYALAENAAKIDGSYLYSHAADLYPVIGQGNGGCTASLASPCRWKGLGTPRGIGAF